MARYERMVAQIIEIPVVYTTQTNIDKYLKCEIQGGNIIDSKTIGKTTKKLIEILQLDTTQPIEKIKISDFFCNKLSDIYMLPIDKKQIIIQQLFSSIYDNTELILPIRLHYLRFKQETVSYSVSCKLFINGIRNYIETFAYFQILNYILRSYLRDENICSDILDEFEGVFDSNETDIYIKMQIADIFLLNGRLNRGNEMLRIIRNQEVNNIVDINDNKDDIYNNVYEDSQNVHDNSINESILKACIKLITVYGTQEFNPSEVKKELCFSVYGYDSIIDTVLERIEIDTCRFTYETNTFSLHNVFSALWNFVQQTKTCNETIEQKDKRIQLHKRIIEEMVSMSRYCSTGHLSRFINVIQGFTDDIELCIKISDNQQIYAIISNYLNKQSINASQLVLDSMIGENRKDFFDFIIISLNGEKLIELLKEYGEIKQQIIYSVRKYSDWYYWRFSENNIEWYNLEQGYILVEDDCNLKDNCIHTVVIDNKVKQMNAKDIIFMYLKNNMQIPQHFLIKLIKILDYTN